MRKRPPWYDDPIWHYNNRTLVAIVVLALAVVGGFGLSWLMLALGLVR